MSAPAVSPLLTVAEVMAALKVSRRSVYRLFASGDLRWVQVGAHRRVSGVELDRFIDANTAVSA